MNEGNRARGGSVTRRFAVLATLSLLAGCAVIPKTGPAPAPKPTEVAPDSNVLPTDADRHRIALLVPMTGANATVGQAIANAATMALLDTNAQSLRITTYDTAAGASVAASKAIGDGNKLILGPLMADDVAAVAAVARPARVPMITYSNDTAMAARDVFVFGQAPGQSVTRVLQYAHAHGVNTLGAIIPAGDYGQRVSAALGQAARASGVNVGGIETYVRTNTSVGSAMRRVKTRGKVDAILIADGARIAVMAAPFAAGTQLLGTELWSGEASIAKSPALKGALFATVSDQRFGPFERSYRARFGAAPARLATLGYDSVLLTLNIARNWKPGAPFPIARMFDPEGFIGTDGVFRFNDLGVAERAMEVRQVAPGTFVTVSPAPARF